MEHLRQTIDHHYLELLRRDGADGRDPDSVRTPKQRLADPGFELMSNRDADTGEFIDHMPNVKAKAATQVILVAPTPNGYGARPRDGPAP